MSNKRLYITLGIMFISLTITGCSQTSNSSIVPAFSDSIIEIPEPEPTEEPEPTDNEQVDTTGANGTSQDIEVDGEIVEGTALTQEELESLLASAQTDGYKERIEGYQQIMETGSWVVPETGGMTCSEVVGKPGDTSWRQMTDEEAKAYQEKYPYSQIGKAELNAGTWSKLWNGKLYFNPYEYEKAIGNSQQEDIDSGNAWAPEDIVIE